MENVDAPAHSSRRAFSNCRILIVEDHPDTARIIGRSLRNWLGVHCTAAGSLSEAQRQFDAAAAGGEAFDVVICDLVLPDGSGLQLPQLLRPDIDKSTRRPRTQLIAVSAMASGDDDVKSLAAGFDGHLRKPFTVDALVSKVQELLDLAPCTTPVASVH